MIKAMIQISKEKHPRYRCGFIFLLKYFRRWSGKSEAGGKINLIPFFSGDCNIGALADFF